MLEGPRVNHREAEAGREMKTSEVMPDRPADDIDELSNRISNDVEEVAKIVGDLNGRVGRVLEDSYRMEEIARARRENITNAVGHLAGELLDLVNQFNAS